MAKGDHEQEKGDAKWHSFEEIASAVIAGDLAKSQELVRKALDGGAKPPWILLTRDSWQA